MDSSEVEESPRCFLGEVEKMLHKNKLRKFALPLLVFIFSALLTTISPPRTPKVADPPPETPAPKPKGKLIDGLPYTKKLRVYTTSYDGNCPGCRGRTYSGTEVKKGVCAVDPKVIPLGTWFYIPNYGKCHAEDIGGKVKGYRIDVGWEDVKKGNLPQGWKDIYILK